MPALMLNRSSRVMPGLRGTPGVIAAAAAAQRRQIMEGVQSTCTLSAPCTRSAAEQDRKQDAAPHNCATHAHALRARCAPCR
jgi:hypothetical protein